MKVAVQEVSPVEDFSAWCAARTSLIQRELSASEDKILRARKATHEPEVDSQKHFVPDTGRWYCSTYGVGHGIPERIRMNDGPPGVTDVR